MFAHALTRSQRRVNRMIEPLERRTLLSAGDLDPSFGLGGQLGVSFPGYAAEGLNRVEFVNNRIVLGGSASDRVALAVLDANGIPVKSFSGDGFETERVDFPGGVNGLAVQPDNKIVVAAGTGLRPQLLVRFN